MRQKREIIPRNYRIMILLLCFAVLWYHRQISRIEARSFNSYQNLYYAFGYDLHYKQGESGQKVLYSRNDVFLRLQPLYIRIDLMDASLIRQTIYVSKIANPEKQLAKHSFDITEIAVINGYEVTLKYELEESYQQSVKVQFEMKKDGYYIYGVIHEMPGRILNRKLVLTEEWKGYLMDVMKALLLDI